eukprot:756332-Hanusia_phi.AAC.1
MEMMMTMARIMLQTETLQRTVDQITQLHQRLEIDSDQSGDHFAKLQLITDRCEVMMREKRENAERASSQDNELVVSFQDALSPEQMRLVSCFLNIGDGGPAVQEGFAPDAWSTAIDLKPQVKTDKQYEETNDDQ